MSKLNDFICRHIINQKEAGVDVVQIFDSWAGVLDNNNITELCFEPNKIIRDFCKNIKLPCIFFPKGIGTNYREFNIFVKPDGLSIDYDLDPLWASENLKDVCLQGGLDPKLLLSKNSDKILQVTEKYLKIFQNKPYIFNLGHGILPETKPGTIQKIIKKVRNYGLRSS